jgi:AcrR family transcriptional regulator
LVAVSTSAPDATLRAATIEVLAESGWDGVTLEKVAERAGRARVTLWRQGVTREALLAALLDDLAEDFQSSLWPVLNAEGTGRERLETGLMQLCAVIDRHLPLVLASDTVFHQGPPGTVLVQYSAPFARFVRDGRADGSLPKIGTVDEQSLLAFNAVAWTYAHMRGHHGWTPAQAQRLIVGLVLAGMRP